MAGHLDYMLLFLAGGACWIFGASGWFSLLGVSTRADAMRRRNPAAAVAIAGGVVGVVLAYAGSNIGNGPTIWTIPVAAFVATAVLLTLWSSPNSSVALPKPSLAITTWPPEFVRRLSSFLRERFWGAPWPATGSTGPATPAHSHPVGEL